MTDMPPASDVPEWLAMGRRWLRRAGHRYLPNLERIEIDITWECQVRCMNCDRSCRQAPTDERMTVEQIAAFVEQSVSAGKRWERITILGGEPTLHPDLDQILDLLLAFRETYSPPTALILASNGHGERTQQILENLPGGIQVRVTAKHSPHQPTFEPFNIAPIDIPELRGAQFSDGCWISTDCGIGLGPRGYYPCGVAGGIDRVFGLDVGLQAVPTEAAELATAMDACCRHCGHFLRGEFVGKSDRPRLNAEYISPTWLRVYVLARRRSLREPPSLPIY